MPQNFYPLRPFETPVQRELENRRSNRPNTETGFSYRPNMGWAKVTSLAKVEFNESITKDGFIMYSNNGFKKIYGFDSPQKSSVLGYTVSNQEHRVSDIGFLDTKRPSPGVLGIESELYSSEGKFVKCLLKWRCNDQYQLRYMFPFFMTPGVSVALEWGWGSRNNGSLLPVDKPEMMKLIRGNWTYEQNKRMESNGNYEMVLGMITKYDFSLMDDGGYECSTEIMSIGYSIYGLSNDSETKEINSGGDKQTKKIKQKAIKRVVRLVDSYLEGDYERLDDDWILVDELKGNSKNPNYRTAAKNLTGLSKEFEPRGFSSKILKRNFPNIKSKISKKDGWISFGLFISLLNREKSMQFLGDAGKDMEAFKVDISRSWITAHPNVKSCDGSILLIPNPFAPAYPIEGDNIELLSENLKVSFDTNDGANRVETLVDNKKFRFDKATESLRNANNFIDKNASEYQSEEYRINIANIITSNRMKAGEPIRTRSFPDSELGYAGHISNLYISKSLIEESLSGAPITISSLFDILKKISTAAGNIWDFDIIANEDNKTQVTIIDRNFPGFDENGNIQSIDSVQNKKEFYTFSSFDYNSIVRGLNFSVALSDEVATQTMFTGKDSNVSRDDDKFFQATLNAPGSVKITDYLVPVEPESNKNNSGGDKDDNDRQQVVPLNDEDYYIVEMDIRGWKNIVIRLAEPNEEIVQSAVSLDGSLINSARFNGLVQGITVNLTLTGISGIKFMDVFNIDNLPYPYNPNAIFQVTNVKHSWSHNDWVTNVEAMIRPNPKMFL